MTTIDLTIHKDRRARAIQRARERKIVIPTFAQMKDVAMLQQMGLVKGGTLNNALVFADGDLAGGQALRFRDECVRHKILDFLGDLAILGCPVIGHFAVRKSGHSLNQSMLKKLVRSSNHWENLVVRNPRECVDMSVNIPVFGHMDPVRV